MNENLNPELPLDNPTEVTKVESAEIVDQQPEQKKEDQPTREEVVCEPAPTEETVEAVNAEEPKEEVQPALEEKEETPKSEEVQSEKAENTKPEKAEEPTLIKSEPLNKDQILEKLKNLTTQDHIPPRAGVEALKHAFYKIRSVEVDIQKAAHLEAEKAEDEFVAAPDPSEDVLKTFLNEIKEKRAKQIQNEEKLRDENFVKKSQMIDRMKDLTENTSDDFNKLYREFKDLQQHWNEVGQVPQGKEKDLWRSYQIYSEKFYDLVKINNEFRDYDFKKNLELKIAICEAVEKLKDESDSISAFHQLQNFHEQWREIGPVAKDLREELWTRFKDASTEINKKYQTHFESMKGKEEENLVEKTTICDALKAIDYALLVSFKEWDEKSKEVIELQAKWKTIGFVPRKVNAQIFEEFRNLCDDFFEKKSEFFKGVKEDMDGNLQKKRALVDRATELKDSTNWKKTTDELIAIQRDWKTIGPVPRKYSDPIWKEFVTACDYFFEQKKKVNSSQKDEETANLSAKKEIIEKIKNIDLSLSASDAITQVKALTEEWHAIGFVPFKEKDKVYKEFHEAADAHYDRLKVNKTERRMEAFKSNMKDISGSENPRRILLKERDYLSHQYTKLKTDLQTYENNMSFLSFSSKGGANSLLKEVNNKMEGLKSEMDLIAKKVDAIDTQLKEME